MEKKIGIEKIQTAKVLYKDGEVITIPFKLGKKLTVDLPKDLTKYLKLNKRSKLYCAIVGGTLQFSAHKVITHIPIATEDIESYETH